MCRFRGSPPFLLVHLLLSRHDLRKGGRATQVGPGPDSLNPTRRLGSDLGFRIASFASPMPTKRLFVSRYFWKISLAPFALRCRATDIRSVCPENLDPQASPLHAAAHDGRHCLPRVLDGFHLYVVGSVSRRRAGYRIVLSDTTLPLSPESTVLVPSLAPRGKTSSRQAEMLTGLPCTWQLCNVGGASWIVHGGPRKLCFDSLVAQIRPFPARR